MLHIQYQSDNGTQLKPIFMHVSLYKEKQDI